LDNSTETTLKLQLADVVCPLHCVGPVAPADCRRKQGRCAMSHFIFPLDKKGKLRRVALDGLQCFVIVAHARAPDGGRQIGPRRGGPISTNRADDSNQTAALGRHSSPRRGGGTDGGFFCPADFNAKPVSGRCRSAIPFRGEEDGISGKINPAIMAMPSSRLRPCIPSGETGTTTGSANPVRTGQDSRLAMGRQRQHGCRDYGIAWDQFRPGNGHYRANSWSN